MVLLTKPTKSARPKAILCWGAPLVSSAGKRNAIAAAVVADERVPPSRSQACGQIKVKRDVSNVDVDHISLWRPWPCLTEMKTRFDLFQVSWDVSSYFCGHSVSETLPRKSKPIPNQDELKSQNRDCLSRGKAEASWPSTPATTVTFHVVPMSAVHLQDAARIHTLCPIP